MRFIKKIFFLTNIFRKTFRIKKKKKSCKANSKILFADFRVINIEVVLKSGKEWRIKDVKQIFWVFDSYL